MARNKVNTAVETIRTNMEKERPKNHPIKEHPLSECDEYIRKLYIDALCVIAQYETEDAEKSLNFVRRVHTGAGLTNDFTEHIKNAMEITVEKFEEFIAQCRDNRLENIFFVDGLIAACADGTPNSKQVDFISEISDALRISKKNVNHLSELAASILEQSAEKYHAACDKIEAECRWAIICKLGCYIKEFVSGVIIDTEDILWIYSKEMTEIKINIEFNDYGEIFDVKPFDSWSNHKEVIIENQKILYYKDTNGATCWGFEIKNCDTFSLKNCYSEMIISFENVVNVNIDKCKFDFLNIGISKSESLDHVFELDEVVNFKFSESSISNLMIGTGCCTAFRIISNDMSLSLSNSHFTNIHKEDKNALIINSCIGHGRSRSFNVKSISIEECLFFACSGNGIEDASMFYYDLRDKIKFENNTFQKCCKLF